MIQGFQLHGLRFEKKDLFVGPNKIKLKSPTAATISSPKMVIIGLTGGIACGKSTVRDILEKQGAHVIDADKLGHKSYEPGQKAYKKIIETFGVKVLHEDNTIKRKALGSIVFSDKAKMRKLEGVVWPCIREMILQQIADIQKCNEEKTVVVEAAVLLEAGWNDMMDQVWVVAVDPVTARERLMARNSLTKEDADKRIAAQMTNEERTQKADVVIWNKGSKEDLTFEVLKAWEGFQHQINIIKKQKSPQIIKMIPKYSHQIIVVSAAVLIGALIFCFTKKS